MTAFKVQKSISLLSFCLVTAMVLGGNLGHAGDEKKPAPPAKPAAAHPAPASHPAGASAGHAPAASGAAHGPTTAGVSHGPTTAGASRGPTTAGASRGPTTAGGSHGPTTAGSSHGPTTEGASRTAGSAREPSTAVNHTAGSEHQTPGKTETRTPDGSASHPQERTQAKGAGTAPRTASVKTSPTGHPVAAAHTITRTKSGAEVQMRPGGHPANVHVASRGMEIHHNLSGGRRVEVVRADHSRVVVERGGRGYVQRPYVYGGREYGHRTYYYGGRAYDRYYYGYPYRGVYVNMYTPAYYYQPAFYGWAYNPWVSPISYSWGWAGNPWYGYYGGYFNPYPVYPSASFWLTDYLISTTLAAAYQARVENAAAAQAQAEGAAPLSPEVKNLISDEVQRQIAVENLESQSAAKNDAPNPNLSGIQAMLNDHVQHVFVAGRAIDVVDANGAECAVSEGDAMQLSGSPAPDATTGTLVILSSKGGQECRVGTTVAVAFADLQDMQNHMRETIDQGMGDLKAKQGKGLPTIPSSANGEVAKTQFAAAGPGPDPQAAAELAQQSKEADQAEKQVLAEVQPSGPGPSVNGGGSPEPSAIIAAAPAAPPKELSKGMSLDDVIAIQGQPDKRATIDGKTILMYKDMNITLRNGKVSDIIVK